MHKTIGSALIICAIVGIGIFLAIEYRQKVVYMPDDPRQLAERGESAILDHDTKQAVRFLTKAILKAPDYPVPYLLLGKAYFLQKKNVDAIAAFNTFQEKIEPVPSGRDDTVGFYVSAMHYISYVYFTLKRYDDAEKVCTKIVKLRPFDQKAHYNLAVCAYIHDRSRERAYRELDAVISADKGSYLADRARFYIDYIRRNPDPRFVADFTFVTDKDN
ncbi:MAG: tetratricopeptide repeat protein [Candidatus Omnitrophica bacterium]|nr:tetratricopeptide repeat protein [Candidatus Omnitrophota bacterium]